jgi:hypothetical protein
MKPRTTAFVTSLLVALGIAYGVHLGFGGTVAAEPVLRARSSSEVDWALLLSYEPKPGLEDLPDAIKALDGKRVEMQGFLLPLYDYDDIREFSLVANHMSCCFGFVAGLNGQVYVKLAGPRGLPWTSEPLRVVGTFRARERKEAGYVLHVYALEDAEAVIVGY